MGNEESFYSCFVGFVAKFLKDGSLSAEDVENLAKLHDREMANKEQLE